MVWGLSFIANSVLLGFGLAMDAFSVSLANGLNDPGMKRRRMFSIAGTFSLFQFAMPMTGWICVHTVVTYFNAFERLVPWIALVLLSYIGGKMVIEGIRSPKEESRDVRIAESEKVLTRGELVLQGIATSIDALSVGFTIADYDGLTAFVCSLIIAAVTLAVCMGGLRIGQTFGTKLAGKASILGGVILICIGLEIFFTH